MELVWLTAVALLAMAAILWLLRRLFTRSSSGEPRPGRMTPELDLSSRGSTAEFKAVQSEQSGNLLQKYGISITVTADPEVKGTSTEEAVDLGDLQLTPEGGWILDPKSTFPLTLFGATKEVVLDLKVLLDESCVRSWHDLLPKISGFLSQANLRCREIETYIQTQKDIYFQKIKELKESSPEWQNSLENDRLDLLDEFRRVAIEHLRVRPQANLKVLFEGQPRDMTIDDKLIGKYGYDVIVFFLRHVSDRGKVYVIPADHYERRNWEKLTELGLANRGDNIQLISILSALTLREMTELVNDLQVPTFHRKAKAVEFLSTVPDIEQRVQRKLAYRQLFQVKALPAEFADVDLGSIQQALAYSDEVAQLLQHTYVMGYFAAKHRLRYSEMGGLLSSWRILASVGACPFCIEQSKLAFAADKPPVVPLHIGCRCQVSPNLEGFAS